ncbi:oligosaccharide flippase family protein [Microbacterium sp. Mu-80]|uniref:Oligosaccharide flippase family protein n=1 Tax=Microbacterium bandirmense TaxID=3122050 RepID=A0ABU8LDC7_9MICO
MFLKRLPRGAGWMTYSYVAGFALQGAYFVLLARALGAAEYGVFVGALSLVTVFASVAGLGSGNVLVLNTARDRERYRIQLGTALVYVSASFLPLLAITLLAAQLLAPNVITALLPLLISELLFTRVYDVGLQSFQSHDQLKGVAHLNVTTALLRVLLCGLFLWFGLEGAETWSWFYAAATVLIALAILAVCFARFGTPRLERESITTTWRLGVFFALGMSSRILLNDSDKFVLAGSGRTAEAGQYGAAHRLVNMAFAPLQAITYSLNTHLFRAGVHGYDAVWRILRRVLPISAGYVLVAGLALWLLAPLAVSILGSDYASVGQMLPVLAVLLVGQAGAYFFGDALMGLGRQGVRSVLQASVGVGVLILNLLLTPTYGWLAAASIAIGASLLLAALLCTVFFIGLHRERRAETETV